jgi:serine/threonine protein kinase
VDQSERYELIDANHGEGGFGRISKRRDKVLDRFVAVKQLRLLDSTEARERFIREAKTLARLNHPNIPAIYDIQQDAVQMHIYLAFVEGRGLRAHVNAEALPSLDWARRWFTQVAAALDHAHSSGVVHRDVKPDNIIISDNEQNATLVDFGIALTAADLKTLTKEGYVIGTPAYMSPEQAAGEDVDRRTDIYSLGITLYETLSGHLPHAGGYQSLSDANEAIPPAIDDLIRLCIAKDRNQRVQTAMDFVRLLRSAFRTDVPLSSLLVDARLHELAAGLRKLSPEDSTTKPRGQKLLVINRLKDLLRTEKSELRTATADVVALLTRIAQLEAEPEYRPIAHAAFEWGFDKVYGAGWSGNQDVRDSIVDATRAANATAHRVLATEFLSFVKAKELRGLPRWYTHDLRTVAMTLLANPVCGSEADHLAEFYDRVNEATH